jgi:RNA recognition motif-containing protein
MQQQLEQENLSFAHKSAEQLEEIKAICGLARLLFPICVDCPFVPNSYVILLAVLMDTNDRIQCDATSTRLQNGWVIDILLKSGIAILNPTTDIRPMVPTEPEIEHTQVEVIISEQAEPSYHIHLPDSVWSDKGVHPSHVQITKEEVFTSENSPQTFLPNAGLNIESDLLLNQTRIQDDIKISNTEVTTEAEEAAKTDWTHDPDTYQTSHSSYSSSSSIQSIAGEDTNEVIEEHDYYLEVEETMDQETEISQPIEDNSAIICVPNLPKYVTVKSLKDLFRPYGPIIDILIEYSDNAKFKNGIITFLERSNAVSAMISMNNTVYRHKKFNIVMAEKKIKLLREYQNRLEDSPLENLASLVQTMTGQWDSCNLEVDPETEMSRPHPEGKMETKNSKQRSKNRSTKKSCKRKIKTNLQEDITKSSKPDVGEASNEEQSEICLEISIGSDEEQIEEVGEIHNDFELQCSVSSHPPDPIYLANCLFAHWEEILNFYEDVKRTNNGAFANETINHLAILIDDASARCQQK